MENKQFSGFQWDNGNRIKCEKHGVSTEMIESMFMRPIAIWPDELHSEVEVRHRAVGRTQDGRFVFLVFTIRHDGNNTLIRPISARYMHEKEVAAYEKANPDIQNR